MEFIINQNIAYLLITTAVLLFILTAVRPQSRGIKIGMVLCFIAAGVELFQVGGNPWALGIVALSPIPFMVALKQPRARSLLVIITIALITIGPVFIFTDESGNVIKIPPLAGFVGLIYGRIIWILYLRARDTRRERLSDNPDSLIGLIGVARTVIEKFETGTVEFEGELWTARSDQPIPAGSLIRIVHFDGLVLTVEKVERINTIRK